MTVLSNGGACTLGREDALQATCESSILSVSTMLTHQKILEGIELRKKAAAGPWRVEQAMYELCTPEDLTIEHGPANDPSECFDLLENVDRATLDFIVWAANEFEKLYR